MGEKTFMQGNMAMAESAIRAGCKLFFGYPITPSSEVAEYFAKAMFTRPEENITFIQAETEVAAFNMIAGAVAAGHRAMTATSGPGFSLGQEAMSFMSCADLPAVIPVSYTHLKIHKRLSLSLLKKSDFPRSVWSHLSRLPVSRWYRPMNTIPSLQ